MGGDNRRDNDYSDRREPRVRPDRTRRSNDSDLSADRRPPPPRSSRSGGYIPREERRARSRPDDAPEGDREERWDAYPEPRRRRPAEQARPHVQEEERSGGDRTLDPRVNRRRPHRRDDSSWDDFDADHVRSPRRRNDSYSLEKDPPRRRNDSYSLEKEPPRDRSQASHTRSRPDDVSTRSLRDDGARSLRDDGARSRPDDDRSERRTPHREHRDQLPDDTPARDRRDAAARSRRSPHEDDVDYREPPARRSRVEEGQSPERRKSWDSWEDDRLGRFQRQESAWAPAWQHDAAPVGEWQEEQNPRRRDRNPKKKVSDSRPDSGYLAAWTQRGLAIGNRAVNLGQTSYRWAVEEKDRFLNTRLGRVLIVALVVILLLAIVASAGVIYTRYSHAKVLAAAALGHLERAATYISQVQHDPFDMPAVAEAEGQLVAANAGFVVMNQDVQGIPSLVSLTPIAGSKLAAASQIAPLAVEATEAGILGCQILAILLPRLRDPLATNIAGLSSADMSAITTKFNSVYALMTSVLASVQTLPADAGSLAPGLAPLLASVESRVPELQQSLKDARSLVTLLPQLLGVGQPANYLLEILDSSELRPGGGVVTSFGALSLSGGRMQGQPQVKDIGLCNGISSGKSIPLPSRYSWFTGGANNLAFQDSNLDADFATDAQLGQEIYTASGCASLLQNSTTSFQGVIAITPQLLENILEHISGPITLPDYHNLAINQNNLIQEIHLQELGGQGSTGGPNASVDPNPLCDQASYSSCFTPYLFSVLLTKLAGTRAPGVPQLGSILEDALQTKDLQVYLSSPDAEAVLAHHDLASALGAPTSGDSLMVVDANEGFVTANNYMTYTWNDQVSIDVAGNATHHLTLTYDWPRTQESYDNAYPAQPNQYVYQDYLRIYVPASAEDISPPTNLRVAGASPAVTTGFGLRVIEGLIYLPIGKTLTIDLSWTVPHAAVIVSGGWLYQYAIEKQAGIDDRPMDIALRLPACGKIAGTPQGFSAPTTSTAAYSQPLNSDLTLSLQYTCY